MKLIILLCSTIVLLGGCASKGVIGVAYNQKGIVKYVFKDSNADKAGVEVEDQILNTKELRGKVGTSVNVRLVRKDHSFELLIERQHIDTLNNPEQLGSW